MEIIEFNNIYLCDKSLLTDINFDFIANDINVYQCYYDNISLYRIQPKGYGATYNNGIIVINYGKNYKVNLSLDEKWFQNTQGEWYTYKIGSSNKNSLLKLKMLIKNV